MPKQPRPKRIPRKARAATPKLTEADLRTFDEMFAASTRGRRVDPRLQSAWIEWEMAPPAKKPSYLALALKYYKDRKHTDSVRRGIKRLKKAQQH